MDFVSFVLNEYVENTFKYHAQEMAHIDLSVCVCFLFRSHQKNDHISSFYAINYHFCTENYNLVDRCLMVVLLCVFFFAFF